MKYDPNSTIPSAHEVRVRMRGVRISENGARVQVSTRSDFIAPDLSPVSTHQVEMQKGTRDWTDFDLKIPAPVNGGVIVGRAERELAEMNCSSTTRIRRPKSSARPIKSRYL